MRHLRITFNDNSVEELESKFSYVQEGEVTLRTYTDMVGGQRNIGPTFVLVNIKKFEWVDDCL